MNDTTKKLDDFGEVIHGAKKHNFADLDLSNEDTKKLPFSKLWPKSEIDAIEDAMVAAVAHHIRNSLPTKPRKPSAQSRWFDKLEQAQTTVAWLIERPENAKVLVEKLEASGWNNRAGAFSILMLAQTDRKHWDKLAFDIRGNNFLVRAGDENHRYGVADASTANIADVVTAMKPAVQESLANFQEAPPKQKELQFSVYRNTATNEIFIAVKSDKHKTPLINFDTVAEARNYLRNEDADIRRENVENLNQLWQEHKELNNIVKADMRSAENTARTGMGYRDGRDITPEEFLQTFNVRGGQFGNWVKGDERQIHLNHAYDAFMDLSKAANIPPSAIGLNGELGIAFGARGSGWAAAHYETQHKVINLTKTKGAGSLAHEWWHALDHYLGDKNLATRDITTIRPENMRHAELSTALQALLKATSTTGLQQRSIKADGYRSKPYFGTHVEMTARAFEKYVANKLEGHGIRNDYLVNIINFEDWQRNSDAYVYPKDDELEAFSQAYDHVFDKLVEVDKSFQREAKAAEQAAEAAAVFDLKNRQKAADLDSRLFKTYINEMLSPSNYHQYELYPAVFTELLDEAKAFTGQFPNEPQLTVINKKIQNYETAVADFNKFKYEQLNPMPVEQTAFAKFNQIAEKYGCAIDGYGRIFDNHGKLSDWKVAIEDNDFSFVRSYNNHSGAKYPIVDFEKHFKSNAISKDLTNQTEQVTKPAQTAEQAPEFGQRPIKPIFNQWTLNDVLQFKGHERFDNHIKDGALKLPLETVLAYEINNHDNNSKLFMDYFRDLRLSTRDWNSPLRQTEMFIQNDVHFDERENRINQVQASFDAIVQRYGDQVIDQAAVFSVDENRVLLSDGITGTAAFGALELQNDLRYERALLAEDRDLANFYRQIPLNPADAAKPLTRDASNQQYNDLFRQRVGLSRFDHDYQQKFESYVQNAKLFIERPVASQAAFGNRISVVENLRNEILTHFEIVKERMAEAEKSVEATSEVAEPTPVEQEQVAAQTKDKASAIRAMANEYMVANGFTVENGNYKYISANGDDRKIVDFDGIYYSVHDKLPDNFTMSDFHRTMMKAGWYEIHDFKNPAAKAAEQVNEPAQTTDQSPEFGQSADMQAPLENEKELPPQHPVEIPADDKGSKLGSSKSDEYLQKIADRILEQVKNNEAPWQMPFEAGTVNNVLPVSGASGTPYKGLNSINLMVQASINGYNDNRWFTYNNAQEAGGQVRRGEKGTQIHFWHIPTKEDVEKEQTKAAAEGREPKNLSPKLRIYTVFNAEQIDGLPERQLNETLLTKFERHEKAESILENSGVRIEHTPEKTGHYSAHYNPRTDTITLPQRELFVSEDAYYATALHELAHATGHESRLNRDLSGAFGSYSYAKEELRAEMASMMIGQELQIGHDPTNHYAYLQSWAAVIENDPKEFFKAAKDADLITNYVLNLDKTKEKVAEFEQAAEQTTEAVKQPTSSYNASIPHGVQTVAKLDKPLEDKVLMLAEKSAIADKIQSVDSEQLKSFVRGIKSAMDFNEHNYKQLLDLATYGNNAFDAREFALHTGMVGDQGVVAYDKALQDLADAGILKSVDDGWKYKLTDEAAYLIKQTYNVVEAEKVTQQEISASQANITTENRRLFVPYEQKDVASALGARWDKDNKTWYAPAGSDLDKFKPWLKEPVREFISPEDEFAKQLEAHGLRLETGHPIMDGQWHRLKVDGDRTGKSGAYIGHLDGVPRGTVKNFKTGQETNWTAKDAVVKSVPSSLDIERAKAAAEAKQKASYNQAADAAKLVLNHAQPAQNHPYLDKKGVAAHGLYVVPDKSAVNLDNTNLAIANDWREAKAMRENFKANGIEKQVLTKGDLIVPAINEHGDVRTFQTISGNDGGFKSFVKGGEKSGSFHVIGDLNNAKNVMIAEGYATAATLHEQTGKPVVVAFDAGNLSPVAEKVRTSLPDARIYIAADNDRNNAVNTGIEKANAAAEKVDAKVIVPQFDKLDGAEKLSDWNDLHKANAHDFAAQLATSDMGRQDFTDKLANLPPERQEVFKGWYDYINEKLANHPESRNTKQASLEQEVKKAEQGLSNLPSVADYQAQQAAKKQAAQVVTQQPTQQATVAIQAPAVDTTAGKGKGGFDR